MSGEGLSSLSTGEMGMQNHNGDSGEEVMDSGVSGAESESEHGVMVTINDIVRRLRWSGPAGNMFITSLAALGSLSGGVAAENQPIHEPTTFELEQSRREASRMLQGILRVHGGESAGSFNPKETWRDFWTKIHHSLSEKYDWSKGKQTPGSLAVILDHDIDSLVGEIKSDDGADQELVEDTQVALKKNLESLLWLACGSTPDMLIEAEKEHENSQGSGFCFDPNSTVEDIELTLAANNCSPNPLDNNRSLIQVSRKIRKGSDLFIRFASAEKMGILEILAAGEVLAELQAGTL